MRTEPAEGKVAENLGLPAGTPVMVLERLRFVNGQVVGYEIRYLPGQIGEALTPDEIHNQPLVPALRRILGKPRTRLSLQCDRLDGARDRRPECWRQRSVRRSWSESIPGTSSRKGRCSTASPSSGATGIRCPWTSRQRRTEQASAEGGNE